MDLTTYCIKTKPEAAEYLEMSVPNFRRYERRGAITPVQAVGRNQMFATRQPSGGGME